MRMLVRLRSWIHGQGGRNTASHLPGFFFLDCGREYFNSERPLPHLMSIIEYWRPLKRISGLYFHRKNGKFLEANTKSGWSQKEREPSSFGRTPLQCYYHGNADANSDTAETADVARLFCLNAIFTQRSISLNLSSTTSKWCPSVITVAELHSEADKIFLHPYIQLQFHFFSQKRVDLELCIGFFEAVH